jgi:uncharacterized SAM-binding protein YcdF (DUF218 family)
MTYIQPMILVLLTIALIGLWRLRNCKGSLLASMGVVGLLLLSWPPVDWLLSRPLEARYAIRALPPASAQVIVVLSSAVDPPRPERLFALPDKETYQRCEFAAWLHKHWQPLPVLACGGRGPKDVEPVSVTMRQMLYREGVPKEMIWTEERSRSTHENAVFGAEILRKRGIDKIVLVVEAQAMPRAEACFRKEGIMVIPAPCEFREFSFEFEEFIPSWKAIKRNEGTLHEVAGLAWYWFRRWI